MGGGGAAAVAGDGTRPAGTGVGPGDGAVPALALAILGWDGATSSAASTGCASGAAAAGLSACERAGAGIASMGCGSGTAALAMSGRDGRALASVGGTEGGLGAGRAVAGVGDTGPTTTTACAGSVPDAAMAAAGGRWGEAGLVAAPDPNSFAFSPGTARIATSPITITESAAKAARKAVRQPWRTGRARAGRSRSRR